jgi:predicted nucleic acid-binding protein
MEIELDRGEAEAIALAAELSADLLLLDERRARRIASRLGLRYIGVLGVLLDAKNRGDLTAVKPVLEALITQAGFWVSTDLYARVIEASGE